MKYAKPYENRTGLPSVNDAVKAAGIAPSFYGVDPKNRDRGSDVHALIDMDINKHPDMPKMQAMIDDGYYGYVDGARQFRMDYKVKVIACEQRLSHSSLGYCGQLDLFARVFGQYHAVIDWKTGSWYDYYNITMAGYELLARDRYGKDSILRLAVMLDGEGGYNVKGCDNPNDLARFMWALKNMGG